MSLKKLGWIFLAVLVLVTLGGILLLRTTGRPARAGEHRLTGLGARAEVRFDRWGVPHVTAASADDAFAALGYLHANDRMAQMELGRRAAFGRLAEVFGEQALSNDVYFRNLRLDRTAEASFESLSASSRRRLDAYARGVNAWLGERGSDLPPDLRMLGIKPEPWRPVDSLAFALLMARDLSFWQGRPEEVRFQWLRAFGAEKTAELLGAPDLHVPGAIAALAAESAGPLPADAPATDPPGSNNWAIGPSRTAAGKAMIANDPHLGLFLPSIWYQVLLRSPDYEAAGMTLPGAPAVVLGRGRHVAWAFTNTMLDDQDLFFEKLDPAGKLYLRGEEWKPLVVEEAVIRIRGGKTHPLTLRSTDRGPLLGADSQRGLPPRSLAWTAHAGGDALAAIAGMAMASNPAELQTAVDGFFCPAQNVVAAFETGELLFTMIGRVPQRRQGDGVLPAPGWDLAYGWDGLRPRETNPTIEAPADDLLVTANHDIRPAGYPLALTSDFFEPHRAMRIRERLEERRDWRLEDFAHLQTDAVSVYAREVVELLGEGFTEDAAAALEVLHSWNGEMAARGPAALYALVERNLLAEAFGDEMRREGLALPTDRSLLLRTLRGQVSEDWLDDVTTPAREGRGEIVGRALTAAWREVRERWGTKPEQWQWDAMHPLDLRHRLDAVPVYGAWARRGPYPVSGSATTILAFGGRWEAGTYAITYGPSMRWVVDWSRPEAALAVLPGGQSGHPADPHYDDQIPLYLEGRHHDAPWSEEAIASAAVSTLRLVP